MYEMICFSLFARRRDWAFFLARRSNVAGETSSFSELVDRSMNCAFRCNGAVLEEFSVGATPDEEDTIDGMGDAFMFDLGLKYGART